VYKFIQRTYTVLNFHNVLKHCKFHACGTVVPSTATASTPAVEIKIATFTGAEHARCVCWLEETKSLQVQRKFCTQYHKAPPSRSTIYFWHNNSVETRCSVCHAKSPSHPCRFFDDLFLYFETVYTGCGKLTCFFELSGLNEKGS
jgi:hypothetical protein